MKIIKKIYTPFLLLLIFISHIPLGFSLDSKDNTIYKGMTDTYKELDVVEIESENLTLLDGIFKFFKDSIIELTMIITIGVFLYLGIRLIVARGNPEEFQKVMFHFTYVIVGIFIISAAWALVKLTAGISLK